MDQQDHLRRAVQQGLERARQLSDRGTTDVPQWSCPACAEHRGVAARSMLHKVLLGGRQTEQGHILGGRWVYACWHCMMRGTTTIAGPAPPG